MEILVSGGWFSQDAPQPRIVQQCPAWSRCPSPLIEGHPTTEHYGSRFLNRCPVFTEAEDPRHVEERLEAYA